MGIVSDDKKTEIISKQREQEVYDYLQNVLFSYDDEAEVEKIRQFLKPQKEPSPKGNK